MDRVWVYTVHSSDEESGLWRVKHNTSLSGHSPFTPASSHLPTTTHKTKYICYTIAIAMYKATDLCCLLSNSYLYKDRLQTFESPLHYTFLPPFKRKERTQHISASYYSEYVLSQRSEQWYNFPYWGRCRSEMWGVLECVDIQRDKMTHFGGGSSGHSTPFLLHYHLSPSHLHALSPLTIPPSPTTCLPPFHTPQYTHYHPSPSPPHMLIFSLKKQKEMESSHQLQIPSLLSYVHCTTVQF